MNVAPLPPLLKKRFELPKSILIVWLIFFTLAIWLGVSRNLDSRALGELCGRFVGLSLFSLLLSWVAWRISRRRDWVKTTVFLIVFFLFCLELLVTLSFRRRVAPSGSNMQLQEQARRIQEAQIEEFKKTGSVSSSGEAVDQMIGAMRETDASGDGLDRKTMTVFADFLQKGRNHEVKHSQASDKINSSWILEPKTAKSTEEITAIASAVTNFMQVNQDFLSHFTNYAVTLTGDLAAKGVPPNQIRSALRGFQNGFTPQLPYIKKIRQQDHKFGQTLLEILELYKVEHGKWKWDQQNELAAFNDRAGGERWLRLIIKVNEIAQEQQQTQSELINFRARKLSRPAP